MREKAILAAGTAGMLLCASCTEIEQDGSFFPEQNGILSKCLSEKRTSLIVIPA